MSIRKIATDFQGYVGPGKPLIVRSHGQSQIDLAEIRDVIDQVVAVEIHKSTEVLSTSVLEDATNLASLRVLGCRGVSAADLSHLRRLEHVRIENCLPSAAAAPNLKSVSLLFGTRPGELVVAAPLTALRYEGRGADDLRWVERPEVLDELVIFDPGVVDLGGLHSLHRLGSVVLGKCAKVAGIEALTPIRNLALSIWGVKALDDPARLLDLDLRFLEVDPNYIVDERMRQKLKERVPSAFITAMKPQRRASMSTKSKLNIVGDRDVVTFSPVEVRKVGTRFLVSVVPDDLFDSDVPTSELEIFTSRLDAEIQLTSTEPHDGVIDHEAGELIYETSSPESAVHVARVILRNIDSHVSAAD